MLAGETDGTHVNDILDELHWRGAVAQTTDETALRAALAAGPITLYCGFDPTAPSLHFGNFVQLVALRTAETGKRAAGVIGEQLQPDIDL